LTINMELDCINSIDNVEKENMRFNDELFEIFDNFDNIISNNMTNEELNKIKENYTYKKNINKYSEDKCNKLLLLINSLLLAFIILLNGIVIKSHNEGKIPTEILINIGILLFTFMRYYSSSTSRLKSVV